MQDEVDILRDVSRRLDGAAIAFMLTGSVAMNFYTEPRMTRDIDLVVALTEKDTAKVVDLFHPDYVVSRDAVRESIAQRSMFNLIHQASVIKVDCIVRKASEYRLAEFERRRRVTIEDFTTCIVSKEDLILSKLEWAKDSHSDFQLRDVRNLAASGCDVAYVERWTRTLGLDTLWAECKP